LVVAFPVAGGYKIKQMKSIKIRYQQIKDARRFVEILRHPDFVDFPAKPESIEKEKQFLRQGLKLRKKGMEYGFSIIHKGQVIGAVGLKVDQHRKYIGEIGYFVDREYWGRGIASAAVGLVERFAFDRLHIRRTEIVTLKTNAASQRVAEKCGYHKEGIQKGKLRFDGKYLDACLFAKTLAQVPEKQAWPAP